MLEKISFALCLASGCVGSCFAVLRPLERRVRVAYRWIHRPCYRIAVTYIGMFANREWRLARAPYQEVYEDENTEGINLFSESLEQQPKYDEKTDLVIIRKRK